MTALATSNEICTVLLVEDDLADARMAKHALTSIGDFRCQVEHVTQLSTALERLKRGNMDLALVDLSLPDSTGINTFHSLMAEAPSVPLVVLTDVDDDEFALELVKRGAQDYLTKSALEPKVLGRSVRYAIERHRVATMESLNSRLAETQSALSTALGDLQTTNEELTQFAYFASHDLQEPVRKIDYYTRQLQEDIGDRLSDNGRKDMQHIIGAVARMQALIRSLLCLSKVGNSMIEPKAVDLECCVTEALESLSSRVEATGAEVVRDPLPEVVGDATLLSHLYENLLSNALKFTNCDRPIIHLTAERNGAQWVLGVRDNGIGVNPECAQRIFQPFHRLHSRTRFEGAGIGLAICQKVVERHGGRIWVESSPGAGAHFKFVLPAKELADHSLPTSFDSQPTHGCERPPNRGRAADDPAFAGGESYSIQENVHGEPTKTLAD